MLEVKIPHGVGEVGGGLRLRQVSRAVVSGVVFEKVPGEVHPAEANMNGTPAGRMGRPQEIAYAAVYLASDESAFVHGIVLDVDGGRTTVAVIAR